MKAKHKKQVSAVVAAVLVVAIALKMCISDRLCFHKKNDVIDPFSGALRKDVYKRQGYDSPSKFASAFHQVMGKTPLEYRKSFV